MRQQETESLTGDPLDWDAWRDEIRAFCRQTISEIQHLTQTAIASTSEALPREVPVTSVPPTTPDAHSAYGGDTSPTVNAPMEESQDRLANLKRQLAAKLNQSPVTDEPGSGT